MTCLRAFDTAKTDQNRPHFLINQPTHLRLESKFTSFCAFVPGSCHRVPSERVLHNVLLDVDAAAGHGRHPPRRPRTPQHQDLSQHQAEQAAAQGRQIKNH